MFVTEVVALLRHFIDLNVYYIHAQYLSSDLSTLILALAATAKRGQPQQSLEGRERVTEAPSNTFVFWSSVAKSDSKD